MSLRRFFQDWNEFFFKPQSPLPVCLFRIFYGIIATANLILLRPEWLQWYGPHAFSSMATINGLNHGSPTMSLFQFLPQTALAVNIFYWVFLLCTVLLTVGYMTRLSSVAVYLFLGSIQMRNGFVLNSGDTLLLVTGFFLMFTPCGAMLSVDHWLRVRQGKDPAVPMLAPWAQRMLQIQTGVVYFATFYWKSLGNLWINGTAVYYALRLEDFRRFPLPAFHNLYLIRTLTWSTLLIEFALGVLIWFKELRYPVLIAGLALHVGIEYAMNIPLFEWIIVATYINFVEPEDLTKMWNWARSRAVNWFGRFDHLRASGHERELSATAVNVTDAQA